MPFWKLFDLLLEKPGYAPDENEYSLPLDVVRGRWQLVMNIAYSIRT